MPSTMPAPIRDLLNKIVSRAKENAANEFIEEANRIQAREAARGLTGGSVGALMLDAAGRTILTFAKFTVAEVIETIDATTNSILSLDATEWVRASLAGTIDGMVTGFAETIDRRRTTGRVPTTAERLERFGAEAKRDVDIELGKASLKAAALRNATIPPTPPPLTTHMFNLLVASRHGEWSGAPFTLEKDRFLQFSTSAIKERFEKLDGAAITELKQLPCLFAYETALAAAPLFGSILDVTAKDRDIRVSYRIVPVSPFVTVEDLENLRPQLQIDNEIELHRRHWAVKEVALVRLLREQRGIHLPPSTLRPLVDIRQHHFRVALSFPGEVRPYVEQVARRLEEHLGDNTVFYDFFYKALLTGPDADLRLQHIYAKQATLLVVFLSAAYQDKQWCGLEWRIIREKIKERQGDSVMFFRTDDGAVAGVTSADGYVDTRQHSAEEVSSFILQRLAVEEQVNSGPLR